MAANSQFAVATHTLLVLAHMSAEFRNQAGLISSDVVASSVNTNPVVIRRVVADMSAAGLVISHPGKNGGLELGRPAEQITLLDVHAAIGDPPVFAFKPNPPAPQCPVGSKMIEVLTPVFASVQQQVHESLEQVTLADLASQIG
ncbi:MAG: Rrf2 family transcriptional regulator [Anaerolineae bacterium]